MFEFLSKATGYILRTSFKLKNIPRILPTILFSFLSTATNLASPYVLFFALSKLAEENENDINLINITLVGTYGAAWTLGRLLPLFRNMLLSSINTDLSHQLTRQLIKQYYRLPMKHRTSNSSAQEAQYFGYIYQNVGTNFITGFWNEVFPSVSDIVGIISIISYQENDYIIGVSLGGMSIIYVASALLNSKVVAKAQAKYQKAGVLGYHNFVERLGRYEMAHYYDNVQFELDELEKSLQPLDKEGKRSVVKRDGFASIQILIIGLGYAGTLAFSAYRLEKHDYTADRLIWIILYMTVFSTSLEQLSKALNNIQDAYGYFKAVCEYLQQPHDFLFDGERKELKVNKQNASISFKNVSLRYEGKEEYALSNVTFTINPGERVAFFGPSGSGKSSILNLLFGFYNPTSGEIKVNKQNITRVNRTSLRKSIAIIPQNPILFNQTIHENVHYGCLAADQTEVENAIKSAQLESFEEEYGVTTPVGEDGKEISGGQKQRICVARALLKLHHESSVFVADEPTSALDAKTSEKVINEIYNLSEGITTLLVTHKKSEIIDEEGESKLDKVIIFNKGKVIAQGTAALLNQRGFFAQSSLEVNNVWETDETKNNLILEKEEESSSSEEHSEDDVDYLTGGKELSSVNSLVKPLVPKPTSAEPASSRCVVM